MRKSHTYNNHDILIRELLEKDIPEIVSSFASIGWQKPSRDGVREAVICRHFAK